MFASTGHLFGGKMSRRVGSEIITPLETFYIVYQYIKGLPSIKRVNMGAYDNLGCWEF